MVDVSAIRRYPCEWRDASDESVACDSDVFGLMVADFRAKELQAGASAEVDCPLAGIFEEGCLHEDVSAR